MKRIALLAAALLAGCATNPGVNGVVRDEVSKFDGVRHVMVSPEYVGAIGMDPLRPMLGASWNDREPMYTYIIIQRQGVRGSYYANIKSLEVRMGDAIQSWPVSGTEFDRGSYNEYSRAVDTKSWALAKVPRAYLQQMVDAPECLVRAVTDEGYLEGNFAPERQGLQITAKARIKEFLTRLP